MEAITVTIEGELLERFARLAQDRGVSVEAVVSDVLEHGVKETPGPEKVDAGPGDPAPGTYRFGFMAIGDSGYTDTSENVDEILAEILDRAHPRS